MSPITMAFRVVIAAGSLWLFGNLPAKKATAVAGAMPSAPAQIVPAP